MKEKKKNSDLVVREPVVSYQTENLRTAQTVIPEYIWEDLRVGLEQYKRGEYVSANVLLVNIKNGI